MKQLSPDLEAKIDEIKMWMFEGDQDRVAAKSRKSREWVSKVLNKHAFNPTIVECAIEVMNENKARFECNHKLKIA